MAKNFGLTPRDGETFDDKVKEALRQSYNHKNKEQKYTKLNVQTPFHRLALYTRAKEGSPSSLSPIITRNDIYKIDFGGKSPKNNKEIIQSIKQAAASALLINNTKRKLDTFQRQFNYVIKHNAKKKGEIETDNNAVKFTMVQSKEKDKDPYYLLTLKDGEKYKTFIDKDDKKSSSSNQELVVLPQKVFSTNNADTADSLVASRIEDFRIFLDTREEVNNILKSFPSAKEAKSKSKKEEEEGGEIIQKPSKVKKDEKEMIIEKNKKVEIEDDEIFIETPSKQLKKDEEREMIIEKPKKLETEEDEIITEKPSKPSKKDEVVDMIIDSKSTKPINHKKEKLPKKLESVSNNYIDRLSDSFSSLVDSSSSPSLKSTTTTITTTTTSLSSSSSNPKSGLTLKIDKQKLITFTPSDFSEFVTPLPQFESMIKKLREDFEELKNRQRKMLARLNTQSNYSSMDESTL